MERPGISLRVWALFAVLTIVATYPLPFRLGTHLLGTGPDPNLYIWTLGWNAYAFLHQPLAIFDANIFHPFRHTLAYSENLIGDALLVAPWIWATGDLVSASNLVQLASILLSGVGACLLGRRLGLSTPAAVVVGLIYAFTPARLLRMPQVHVTSIHWIPWCLAYLHAYVAPGGRPRDLRLAIAFFALQAITSGHGVVFLVVAVLIVLAWRLTVGDPPAPLRRLRDCGWPGAAAIAIALLCFLPYRAARADVGSLTRTYETEGLSFSSYLSSPSRFYDWLWPHLPSSWTTPAPEASLFPGVVPMLLALVGILGVAAFATRANDSPSAQRHLDNPVVVWTAILVVSVWFVIGPPYGLWRWTYSLPVFSFMRVPTRFVLLEILALAVLSGFGVEWLRRRAAASTARALTIAALALFAVESLAAPLPTEAFTLPMTSADRWLATRPRPFAIAEVPVADSLLHDTQAVWETRYMLHATAHWQPTVHGYSGVDPDAHHALIRTLVNFPDEASLVALSAVGVTYVVVHPKLYEPAQLADVEARLARFGDRLKLQYAGADGKVYALAGTDGRGDGN